MSRRPPNPAAERGAQNQQTLKTLVKVESNKTCADCKKNKHPRWASWNIGIFLCIRCSGIHRGMGTHISRVKSVDLDAWTDDQLASMLKWGNVRANKYWEAKLSQGHVPADAKIENFIRTKYESRRWVMDGPMPDPSTLGVAGDDEVPLNVVQEKAKLERSASARVSSAPSGAGLPAPRPPAKQVNLFDDDDMAPPPPRPNSVATPGTRPPPPPQQQAPTQVKPNKTGDSLLGFDFFGPTSNTAPPRPGSAAASTPGTSSGPSRPDLKQSILSLYAAKPNPPPTQSQNQHQRAASGAQQTSDQASLGGLDDAFGGLDFNSQPKPAQQPAPSPFASLTSPTSPPNYSRPSIGGGGFFDSKPVSSNPPPVQATQPSRPQRGFSSSSGFGDFTSAASPPAKTPPAPTPSKQGNGLTADLFDFGNPSTAPAPATLPRNPPPVQASNYASTIDSSVFNLSSPKPTPTPTRTQPPPPAPPPKPVATSGLEDPWGASDVWASNDAPTPPAPAPAAAPVANPAPFQAKATPAPPAPSMGDFGGWASSTPTATAAPRVTADEDFGGWESQPVATSVKSSAPTSMNSAPPPAPPKSSGGGFGTSEDLFSNVWE